MIETIATHLVWLIEQHVPLWAFLLALATSPLQWSKKGANLLEALANRVIKKVEKED